MTDISFLELVVLVALVTVAGASAGVLLALIRYRFGYGADRAEDPPGGRSDNDDASETTTLVMIIGLWLLVLTIVAIAGMGAATVWGWDSFGWAYQLFRLVAAIYLVVIAAVGVYKVWQYSEAVSSASG